MVQVKPDFISLVGPTGTGKSTFLMQLCQVQEQMMRPKNNSSMFPNCFFGIEIN